MRTIEQPTWRPLPDGYRIEVECVGGVVAVRIVSSIGELTASGYAVETDEAFIYDRISTTAEHRRKGLGHALMHTLRGAKRQAGIPELLVATEDGRALYETLGWRVISPYSTGVMVET